MNDVQSNNETTDLIGKRVVVLDGYGKGRMATVAGYVDPISFPGSVDLYVDDDEMGEGVLRRNYSPGTFDVIVGDADTNGDGVLNLEDMVPPRGTVVLGYSGTPNEYDHFLVDARHDDTVLLYRISEEAEGVWRFFNSNAPIDWTVEKVAQMAWANPQPPATALVAMAMEVSEKRRREMIEYRDRLSTVQANHQSWIETLTADAHEYADEHRLCDVFDNWMVEHGLEPRAREWDVDVSVSMTVSVRVKARTEDEARDLALTESSDGEYEGLDYHVKERISRESYDHDVYNIEAV